MRWSISGLLKLKPFDESEDVRRASDIYAGSIFFTVSIVVSSVLALAALVFSVTDATNALVLLGIAVGISAVAAGLEWHAGLKARAMNQLFAVVLVCCLFGALRS